VTEWADRSVEMSKSADGKILSWGEDRGEGELNTDIDTNAALWVAKGQKSRESNQNQTVTNQKFYSR
jgi:hypothetical protein